MVLLKKEVEEKTGTKIQMTITGALEAHLLAKELAEAEIGVIQVTARPFPTVWERRRMCVHFRSQLSVPLTGIVSSLPGHPLSEKSSVEVLVKNNVTVGIGIQEAWAARNTRFDIAWVRRNTSVIMTCH